MDFRKCQTDFKNNGVKIDSDRPAATKAIFYILIIISKGGKNLRTRKCFKITTLCHFLGLTLCLYRCQRFFEQFFFM